MTTTTERYQLSKLSAAAKDQHIEEILRWAPTIWRADIASRAADGRLVGSTTIKLYRIPYEGRDLFAGKVEKLAQHLAQVFGLAKADSPHPVVYRELFSAIETRSLLTTGAPAGARTSASMSRTAFIIIVPAIA